ncbi:hypothetical protein M1397_02465 [Candidatus Marsarchaeota archaeon]|nr:hypothetical protein [Candidatus Marsarchaeota archaeon]
MVEKEDMLIFKLREKRGQQQAAVSKAPEPALQAKQATPKAQAKTQAKVQRRAQAPQPTPPQPRYTAPAAEEAHFFSTSATTMQPVEEAEATLSKQKTKIELESREAALGQQCEWHPWRAAYAVCYACHKPYCYEDISEYDGKYYCLEDIDKARLTAKTNALFVYNKIGIASAGFLIIALPALLYFSSGILTYIGSSIAQQGFNSFIYSNFIQNINADYAALFSGMVFVVVEFFAGLMIFAQSNKGYIVGIIAAFASIAAFSYIFIETSAPYSIVVASLSFVGMVLLAYSKNASISAEQENQLSPFSDVQPYNWPNMNRF